MTARLDQIEVATTQAGRIVANTILSVIPGARHNPGRMRLPPLPDQLGDWEPVGYPATVVCEDDEEVASGFRSFGVTTVPACEPDWKPDLFVVCHADRLTEKSVNGVLLLAERSKWFVLLMQTCDDWETARTEHEPRADGSPSILAPIEWWRTTVEIACERAKLRDDLVVQAKVIARRLGQPRAVDSILVYETK